MVLVTLVSKALIQATFAQFPCPTLVLILNRLLSLGSFETQVSTAVIEDLSPSDIPNFPSRAMISWLANVLTDEPKTDDTALLQISS